MKILCFVLAGALCACSAGLKADAKPDQPVMFQGNALHTGVFDVKPIYRFEEIRFAFKTGGPVRSSAALKNGVLYFGSGDGNLYAVDAQTGKERWRFKTGGAVHSSPALSGGTVYFSSRDGCLYAVDAMRGNEVWKFRMSKDLPYDNGFDYYLSSPTVVDQTLYIGGGDGVLYAFDVKTKKVRWKYASGARIRVSPAVVNGIVLIGTVKGNVIAVSASTGTPKWTFATKGASLKIEDFGYDRSAIISSPSVADDIVTFGCRDGFLYALDLETGKERWNFNHEISWVLSTPSRSDGVVYAGSSDAQFFQAVDEATGKERWRFKTGGPVWSSGAIAGSIVYIGSNDGILYALDKATGAVRWKYRMNDRIFCSPLPSDGVVYCGSDDGTMYALAGSTEPDTSFAMPRRAVFWESNPGFANSWFSSGTEETIRDYFERNGYEVVDSKGLEELMNVELTAKSRSVIVFCQNRVPENVTKVSSDKALLRQYLDSGGKIVWLGANPLAYVRDSTGSIQGIDFEGPQSILGIRYPGKRLEAIGWYSATVTPEGTAWGLHGWWVGLGWVNPAQVTTVLALDENGMAAAWVKNYGGPAGTGLVQLSLPRDKPVDLYELKTVAEHGLWK